MSIAPLRSVSRRPLNLDRHGFHADRAALGRDRHRDRRGDRTPRINRARAAAFESWTIGTLRAINGAKASFGASCGSGFFAPSLRWLSLPPSGSGEGFIGRSSIRTASTETATACASGGVSAPLGPRRLHGLRPGRAVFTYFAAASPLRRREGSRYFATNQSGTIYQSARRIRVTLNGPPPPPARPIE